MKKRILTPIFFLGDKGEVLFGVRVVFKGISDVGQRWLLKSGYAEAINLWLWQQKPIPGKVDPDQCNPTAIHLSRRDRPKELLPSIARVPVVPNLP